MAAVVVVLAAEVAVTLVAAAMSVASVELLISEAGWVGFTHPGPRFPVPALA